MFSPTYSPSLSRPHSRLLLLPLLLPHVYYYHWLGVLRCIGNHARRAGGRPEISGAAGDENDIQVPSWYINYTYSANINHVTTNE